MKKELLFVVDEREMGGVSVVLNDLVHLLNPSKYDIDILVLHDKGHMLEDLPDNVQLIYGTPFFCAIDYTIKDALKTKNISIIFSKLWIIFGLKTKLILKMIQRERRKIIKKNYDVEIAYKDGFCALFTACGNSPKKIHCLHCSYKTFNPNEKYPALFNLILPKFDHIVGVATNVVKEFNDIYHLDNITEVIPVVIDVDRIKRLANEKPKYKPNRENLNIVLLGRCHPVKGYDRLFDVVHKLNCENVLNDVKFTIFGDGPLYSHLQKRCQTENLDSVILMKGNIDNPYAEIRQYDLLLLPSYSEAFGTVISEAFILGVPVIATETSASLMSVKMMKNGLIVENSENGLYESLKHIIQNRELLSMFKENLRDFNYENDLLLKKIESLFDEEVLK